MIGFMLYEPVHDILAVILLASSEGSDQTVQIMCGSRGGGGDRGSGLPRKSRKYRVSYQYWSGSPSNHKATNVGPSSARQQNAIVMVFPWWAKDCPLIVVFGSFLSSPN